MNEHINVTDYEIDLQGFLIVVDFSYDIVISEGFQDESYPMADMVSEHTNYEYDITAIYFDDGEEITEDQLHSYMPDYKELILTDIENYRQ